MTAAQDGVIGAFDRLVVAARRHPLAFLIPAEAEAIGRTALANGLTADQARAVRKNLDSAHERKLAAAVLLQLVAEADALTLLTWLAAEVARALAVTEAAPETAEAPPSPSPDAASADVLRDAVWIGRIKGAEFLITAALSNVKTYRKGGVPRVRFSCSGEERWPVRGGEKPLQSSTCAFFLRDGKWTGGFVEYNKAGNDEDRGLENTDPGDILSGIREVPGERCLICVTCLDRGENVRQRSNAVETTWP